jgi:hypothetical protein
VDFGAVDPARHAEREGREGAHEGADGCRDLLIGRQLVPQVGRLVELAPHQKGSGQGI